MQFVEIEKNLGPEGRVAVVRFDRGDRINALSPQAMRELRAAAQSFEDDHATSVVVLTGNAYGFSAGFDLRDAEGAERGKLGLAARRAALMVGPRMCRAWYEMEQVTICAVEGHCVGGGAALAVSLDFRFCGRNAHFRIPEVELGMNMSWGSVPRILQLIGPARTKQAVILASDRISAPEAERWGLVERVTEDHEAFTAAFAFAERIAAQPPIPTMMTKTTVNRLAGALDDLASHMDRDQFALTNLSEDHAEGVAAFLGRRKPRFRGR
ncbi:MAG: enoyl-CoA hydratase/isomerase family protein [Hyphomicrobiales bacterium]|nr:enoyl-CoA hydratase/isomerase family protein [Hyphomicrobiales bacterium]